MQAALGFGGFSGSAPDVSVELFRFGLFFEGGLGGGQARHGDAEGGATNIGQTEAMTELHAVRVAAVLAADAQLNVRAGAAALFNRDLHELADAGLID